MAEWLRRQIRNLMGFSRVGSNPTAVDKNYYIVLMCAKENISYKIIASMAERSKAIDSSSIPFGGVSSNLTGCIYKILSINS
jgi:hypothetical protein